MEAILANWEQNWTAVAALQLVSVFFNSEWPQTTIDDVQLTKVTGGFCHRLHLLSRSTTAIREPSRVLIRNFGPSGTPRQEPRADNTTLSAAQQAIVYNEMGRRGWGPKIYGLFTGGRLEEYIDSHPLTAVESMQPAISRDVARAYARLHSLHLPLPRRNVQLVVHQFRKKMEKKDDIAREIASLTCPEAAAFAAVVRETDWSGELDWVSGLFAEHDCQSAVTIDDTNFLNVLVKDFSSECRIVLIDYETATYGYRGVDIGGHFTDRMYCWSNPKSSLTGYSVAGADEQRSFCASYLEEMRVLGVEMTANDTEEHLLLEAKIGQMYQILWSVLMGFQADSLALPDDSQLFIGLGHMMQFYRQLKDDFEERFNQEK